MSERPRDERETDAPIKRKQSIVCPDCGHSTLVDGQCVNPICDHGEVEQ